MLAEYVRARSAFLWGWLAALTAYTLLAVAVAIWSPLPGEARLERWVQRLPVGWLAGTGNVLGDARVAVPVAALAALLLLLRRRRDLALLMALCAALRPIGSLLKAIDRRPRPTPEMVRVLEHASGYAYPSGHAFGAALCWGGLAVVAWRLLEGRWRLPAALLFAAVPLVTGLGRVYAGAHWPSDVLGGWLAGGLLVSATATLIGGGSSDFRSSGPLDQMGAENGGSIM